MVEKEITQHQCKIFEKLGYEEVYKTRFPFREIDRKKLDRFSLHHLVVEVDRLEKENLFQVPDIRVEVETPLSEIEIGYSFGPQRRRRIKAVKCLGLESVESFSHGGPVKSIKRVCNGCIFEYMASVEGDRFREMLFGKD